MAEEPQVHVRKNSAAVLDPCRTSVTPHCYACDLAQKAALSHPTRVAEETPKKPCPSCGHDPLLLLTFAAGKLKHVRVGCLCRSAVFYPDIEEEGQPSPQRRPETNWKLPAVKHAKAKT